MISNLSVFVTQIVAFGCFVLASAFAINFLARRRSAEFRHLIWVIAVSQLLIVPPAALWMPKLTVPIATDLAPFSLTAADVPPTVLHEESPRSPVPAVSSGRVDQASVLAVDGPKTRLNAILLVGIAYLLVTLLLSLRLIRSIAIAQTRVRKMKQYRDAETEAIVRRIGSSMGIRRKVRVLVASQESTPWTWGLFQPVIVVPREFRDWSRTEQTNALVHEIAHIRRFDFLTALLGQLCLTLNWFQPLAWLANRAMSREAEYACDDQVAAFGASGSEYASQLLRTAHAIAGFPSPSPLVSAMAGRGGFAPRVSRILDSTIRRTAMSALTRYSVLAVGILVTVPLASLRSQPADELAPNPVSNFQSILINGPSNEAELDLLVSTFVDTGQQDRAQAAFVEWLSATGDAYDGCHYCSALLNGEDQSEAAMSKRSILRSAFNDIEALARSQADPELLMRLVYVLSSNAQLKDLGGYYLVQARTLGELSDSQELIAAIFLANAGQYEAGLKLVQKIHSDPDSDYYQSPTTRQWIGYMNDRKTLMDRIEEQLSDDSGAVTSTYEYLPAYKEAPVYPPAATDAKAEGQVVVQYTVTSTGRTSDATVVESSNSLFDASALNSVANYRYMPRVLNGVATDVYGVKVKTSI